MNKDKFSIDYPNENTISEQINKIVIIGMPAKDSFYSYLKRMYQHVGFKHLFSGMTEIIYAILLFLFVLLSISYTAGDYFSVHDGRIYSFIFIVSPILYLLICLFCYWKLKQTNTYEIEMTCKYNIFQLAAFRMLAFSIICLGVNMIFVSVIVSAYEQINFLLAFMISVTSLFLFSGLFLFFIMKMHARLMKVLYPAGWLLVNIILSIYSKEIYHLWIKNLPIYVYIVLSLFCIWLYLRNLQKLITFRRVEGVA
ncbi:hypothetical protein [Bacillus sp. 03113]|uniref:hypothetical protein n=1 Tax=Bacillus sp. 03113 TaxID=2578211 RepID=UPI0011420A0F|nr:hypothetical protein [Bacillus sp. 03113]